VEREEFWTDGLTVAQRTDAQQPRSAADLELMTMLLRVLQPTAPHPTRTVTDTQQIRVEELPPQVTIGKQTVETNVIVSRVCVKG
jgi:hypothetical protein